MKILTVLKHMYSQWNILAALLSFPSFSLRNKHQINGVRVQCARDESP